MAIIKQDSKNAFLISANGTGNLSSQNFTLSSSGIYVASVFITGVSDCNTTGT